MKKLLYFFLFTTISLTAMEQTEISIPLLTKRISLDECEPMTRESWSDLLKESCEHPIKLIAILGEKQNVSRQGDWHIFRYSSLLAQYMSSNFRDCTNQQKIVAHTSFTLNQRSFADTTPFDPATDLERLLGITQDQETTLTSDENEILTLLREKPNPRGIIQIIRQNLQKTTTINTSTNPPAETMHTGLLSATISRLQEEQEILTLTNRELREELQQATNRVQTVTLLNELLNKRQKDSTNDFFALAGGTTLFLSYIFFDKVCDSTARMTNKVFSTLQKGASWSIQKLKNSFKKHPKKMSAAIGILAAGELAAILYFSKTKDLLPTASQPSQQGWHIVYHSHPGEIAF
jgi:hypothetical protein